MISAARLISRRYHNIPGRLRVAELFFDVPLDHSRPSEGSIRLFARSVKRRASSAEPEREEKPLPWFLYLQGGPGSCCSPPQEYGWIGSLIDKGYQILFLDQRGTGLSTAVTAATLARQPNAVKQAEYLRKFRADSIVRDCEAVRNCLTADYPLDRKRWSVIGQSFGGFCAVTYLSKYPEGLKEVFTCGGLPPLVNGPDPVYMRTYEKVQERNEAYYKKFPEDVSRVASIMRHLTENETLLPSGAVLTPALFRQLGITFGMHGGLDVVHDIVLRTQNDLEIFDTLTRGTLAAIENATTFDNGILYAILHEAIYCQGQASNWSADRLILNFPRFQQDQSESGIFFTGEMIYRGIFESSTELSQLKNVADILAAHVDWPELYNEEQLAKNEIPVYSATYIDDMYVHYELAAETASKIKNCRHFITNAMYHNALRGSADELMKQLFALRDDTID